ncbi:hypothetical protein ACL9RL_07330 [Plantibacter sp. Mn2098]|uniref:hypothetical protein n=1 Tax=Plantibacter sp. Mn2098 TaxID=3395266 RepID=UPI003BE1E334
MSDYVSPPQIELQAQWIGDPAAVPAPVNQFIVQSGPSIDGTDAPDTFFITFGHMVPPFVPPGISVEDANRFATENVALVAPVGKFTLTTPRMRELYDVLGRVIAFADEHPNE